MHTSTRTVRDATVDVMRRFEMTTMFANPGSTEISLLADLPEDVEFVLALHEGSVVGMATGWALSAERPALVVLHTTAGLGNAVGALATARVNRAPLVVLVGQQDRRHLASEPFLAGRLTGLAGDYPLAVTQPARAQDVPSAVARAWHQARHGRGPVIVVVPMDDWQQPAEQLPIPAPDAVRESTTVDDDAVRELAGVLGQALNPALAVGSGADSEHAWQALVALAEALRCPVWQEPFGARAGFPQDHRLFAGHLPAGRARLRETLSAHDVVLCVGAAAFRQYPFEPGPFVAQGTRLAVVTDDPDEAHRSPAALAVLGDPAVACEALAKRVTPRDVTPPDFPSVSPLPTDGPLRAGHVFDALAARLPCDAVVVEETPSSRPEMHLRLPARAPLGFLSAAMGGLGFAIPAATGVKMAARTRPVVAVVGDGSSLYAVQALWSAAHYGCGALFVVLANGRYAVMDRLAEKHGPKPAPWPGFHEVSVSGMARSLGCAARRVATCDELLATLDEVVPTLPDRTEPLLLEVVVPPDPDFEP